MAREKNCCWHFAEHIGGIEQGANNAVAQNFKKHPYASIVRESIQNSLDAVDDKNKPVKVEYLFKSIEGKDFPRFFELKDHIQGCIDYFSKDKNARDLFSPMLAYFSDSRREQQISYIKISDYNTKGMDYYTNGEKGTFYAFMKAAGFNLKNDSGSGGSFGFGKGAYYVLSPIRTLLISTMNRNKQRCFEGASMLSTHTLGTTKKKYVDVGYYDEVTNPEHPIMDFDSIPVPFRRDEPGTDFFVMGFDLNKESIATEEMIKSVLRNFWMAILQNRLEVKIGEKEITARNLPQFMDDYFPSMTDTTKNGSTEMNPRPYFDAVYNNDSDPSKYFYFEDEISYLGSVKLYVHKTKDATDGDKVTYMRKQLMMIDKRKGQSNQGYYGVFICDDKRGNEILQAMENPAHDEWKTSNWESDGVSIGRPALAAMRDFIARSVDSIFSIGNGDQLRISGLEKYLYTPSDLSSPQTDGDESENPFTGNPTGKVTDNGTSLTTDIDLSTLPEPEEINSTVTGQVNVVRTGDATASDEGNTPAGAGAGNHKSKEKGGNKHANNEINPSIINESESANFRTVIDVSYRQIAQKENGQYVHYLKIVSPYDVTQGELVLELDKDKEYVISILECDNGEPRSGNEMVLENVKLKVGVNTIRIKFEDCYRKHGIHLEAYSFLHQ